MKKFLLILMLAVCAGTARSQTLDLQYLYPDTLGGSNGYWCNVPNVITFYSAFLHTGYANGTVFTVTINFGDGNTGTGTFTNTTGSQGWGSVQMQHTYQSPGTYYPQAVVTAPGGQTDTLTLTQPVVIQICGNIEGTLYVDNNSNCVFDSGDAPLSNQGINILDPNTQQMVAWGITAPNGDYSIPVPTGSSYVVALSNPLPALTINCPTTGSYTVTSLPSTGNDFALECNSQFDLSISGWTAGIVPGMSNYFYLIPANSSCITQNATLKFVVSQSTITVNSTSVPSTTSGDTLIFNLGALTGLINLQGIKVYFTADTTLQLGDTLCFPMFIEPVSGDANPSNNTYNLCRVVTSSFDPNMKEGWHGKGAIGAIKPNTTLTYTIQFQNTGTAPAMRVYIRDTLPNELDPSTLKILSYSHPMKATTWNNTHLLFEFDNINLPDSNSNEPESHGFVMYSIAAKEGLPHGTQIRNGAGIFFDYNAPVITNYTLHTIDHFLSVETITADAKVEIYPNPAGSSITVNMDLPHGNLLLFDLSGRMVFNTMLHDGSNLVKLPQLAAGTYIYHISGADANARGKLMIR